jgi:Mg2+/Co2+ transporter CorC
MSTSKITVDAAVRQYHDKHFIMAVSKDIKEQNPTGEVLFSDSNDDTVGDWLKENISSLRDFSIYYLDGWDFINTDAFGVLDE